MTRTEIGERWGLSEARIEGEGVGLRVLCTRRKKGSQVKHQEAITVYAAAWRVSGGWRPSPGPVARRQHTNTPTHPNMAGDVARGALPRRTDTAHGRRMYVAYLLAWDKVQS